MGKVKATREVSGAEVNCLEYLVVAYNTVFLMSSIFLISIASTAEELFSDFNRLLSPSTLLLIVGSFIVLTSALGYVGIAKKSSTLLSMYTLLLMFIFVMEISAGLGILSFRREIKTMVTSRMSKAIHAYPHEPLTANVVDFFQLELRCCGINDYQDWEGVFEPGYLSNCKAGSNGFTLPQSCCRTVNNTAKLEVTKPGCLPALNFMLHRSSLLLSLAIICICGFQVLGAYFSYALASTLRKFKTQNANEDQRPPPYYEVGIPVDNKENNNYF